jgi:hypothetical protein
MKVFQYFSGTIPAIVQQCIDQVSANIPAGNEHTLLTTVPYVIDTENLRCASNFIRLSLLRDNPNSLWLDCDCQIKSWFTPPSDGKIYCNKSQSVLFDNGQTAIINEMLADYNAKTFQHTIGWIKRLTESDKYKNHFALIPDGHFMHFSLSTIPKHDNWGAIDGDGYSIYRNTGNLTIKVK